MNYTLEAKNRSEWIATVVKEAGAKGIVIGLSGGKDSACVASLCIQTGFPVVGVNIPIQSAEEDMKYVEMLRNAFTDRLNFSILPFTPVQLESPYYSICNALLLSSPEKDRVVTSNIKARLRMLMLYAIANKLNYLVAGTGNLSEGFVGYFTKWGDGACDFNPIADLLVQDVIGVGIAAGAPKEAMHRTPSAGLYQGQTDEGEMGLTYTDIASVIRGDTVDPDVYKKVMQKHYASTHKRVLPASYDRFSTKSTLCIHS